MSQLKSIATLLLSALLATACATPASRDAMEISGTNRVQYQDEAFLSGSVMVGSVTGGKETNPAWTSEISNTEFEAALKSSLETALLDSTISQSKYTLDVELVEIDQPAFGFTFTVKCKVKYALRDNKTRQLLLDQMIESSGTATAGDSIAGVKRLRIATERSAQSNIQQIVDILRGFKP